MVLQQMQVLNQQITPSLALPEERLHFGEGARIDLPALWLVGPAPAARTGMDATVVSLGWWHRQA